MSGAVGFPLEQHEFAFTNCSCKVQQDQSHDWIAFIDLDEFILLKQHETILDLLSTVSDDTPGVLLSWTIFDFNQEINYRPLPVTKRFTRRFGDCDETRTELQEITRTFKNFKTIARTNQLVWKPDGIGGISDSRTYKEGGAESEELNCVLFYCKFFKLWWLEMVNFIEVLEDIGILVDGVSVCLSLSIWNGFGIN